MINWIQKTIGFFFNQTLNELQQNRRLTKDLMSIKNVCILCEVEREWWNWDGQNWIFLLFFRVLLLSSVGSNKDETSLPLTFIFDLFAIYLTCNYSSLFWTYRGKSLCWYLFGICSVSLVNNSYSRTTLAMNEGEWNTWKSEMKKTFSLSTTTVLRYICVPW